MPLLQGCYFSLDEISLPVVTVEESGLGQVDETVMKKLSNRSQQTSE